MKIYVCDPDKLYDDKELEDKFAVHCGMHNQIYDRSKNIKFLSMDM